MEEIPKNEEINNWKILSYVLLTWFLISIIANILVVLFSENQEYDLMAVTRGLFGFASLFLGIIMSYRLKKKIEFVYGFILFFVAPSIMSLSFIIGLPLTLSYFWTSYIKLEHQRLGKRLYEANLEKKVNIWKIFIFTIITLFAVATLARILITFNYPVEFMDAQSDVWSWSSIVLGVVMGYKLKKIVELAYGGLFFFVALLSYPGMVLAIIYFARCYYELEKRNLSTI